MEFICHIARIDQKNFYARVVKFFTRDRWSHAMIFCLTTRKFIGLDIAFKEKYHIREMPKDWEWEISEETFSVSFNPEEKLEFYNYRFFSNINYLLYKIPVLRRFIKVKPHDVNCVGFICRVFGLEPEKEFRKPGNLADSYNKKSPTV